MLLLNAFTRLQAALLAALASLADPGGDAPLDLTDTPEVTAADLNAVYIESIETYGQGCPVGTVHAFVADEKTSFSLRYDRMYLLNPNISGRLIQSKECHTIIRLHVPNGLQFSVMTVHTRSHAFLSRGIRARQTSRYTLGGSPPVSYVTELKGPYSDDYAFADTIPVGSNIASGCGASEIIVVDHHLLLDARRSPRGRAAFNLSETGSAFEMLAHLQWKKC